MLRWELFLLRVDDEEDGDRRKGDCLDDMQYLEQQFSDLKELYVTNTALYVVNHVLCAT